jgi:dolichol kinase
MNHIAIRKNELLSSGILSLFPALHDINDLRTEIVRKSIHFLIALSPTMAALNRPFTVAFLMIGTLLYAVMETLRISGIQVPFISSLTAIASRTRDRGRFVLGPVTLGLGALLALILYPSSAASIGIYALAFGDGFASLVGKLAGRIRPSFMLGKSIEGSSACFAAVFISAYALTGRPACAFIAALTATLVEVLPLEDYDNLALPVTVGLVVQVYFSIMGIS